MYNSLRRFLIIPMIYLGSLQTFAQCNGHAALCGKRYNEVAYLTTHNAFNAEEDGFNLPNQTYGLTQQLNDGVRGLMLDVYDEGGIATVYHSLAFLGTTPLESNLTEIKDFLDANPNEIVTIIFECYADFELIETAFINTETLDYTLEQDLGSEWPTLQEMIAANKRLVVLSDRNDAALGEDWYHYVWDYAVETPFSNNSNSDFTCEFNRGDENNDLFILNHFATDANLGVGRTDLSELANEFNFFYSRARDCEATLGKFPNFPTVDFYELGNTLEVVDSLNGIPSSVGIEEKSPANSVSVFPNPSKDAFICGWVQSTAAQISLFDHAGSLVWQTFMNETSITIDLSPYPVGIYHVQMLSGEAVSTFKLVRN